MGWERSYENIRKNGREKRTGAYVPSIEEQINENAERQKQDRQQDAELYDEQEVERLKKLRRFKRFLLLMHIFSRQQFCIRFMRIVCEMDNGEIVKRTGLSRIAVRGTVHRSMKKIENGTVETELHRVKSKMRKK